MRAEHWQLITSPPPFPPERREQLARRIGAMLATSSEVVFVRGESRVALEAVAKSVGSVGFSVLNVVTSPYGSQFGSWLRRSGAKVRDLSSSGARPVEPEAVAAALGAAPADVIALAHGEPAVGFVNPLREVAAIARRHGAMVVVDAIASVGAELLDVDELGLDLVAIGAQKALAGPGGISAVSVSPRAWAALGHAEGDASALSLLALRKRWSDDGPMAGRDDPATLELWALDAAMERVEAEGVDALVQRHQLAGRATRRALAALGVGPWMAEDTKASALVTAASAPSGVDPDTVVAAARDHFGVVLTRASAHGAARLVRLHHTGPGASFPSVLAGVAGYGGALRALGVRVDLEAALSSVVDTYAKGRVRTGA